MAAVIQTYSYVARGGAPILGDIIALWIDTYLAIEPFARDLEERYVVTPRRRAMHQAYRAKTKNRRRHR